MIDTIEKLYEIFQQHPLICTDTRNIIPGSIFFALKGEHFDANLFAESAINKGCSYAVVDNKNLPYHNNFIKVENSLETLQELAKLHRAKLNIPIIGITGTNGKTTTKELIHAVLSECYNVTATKGNYNNHIGVPITVLSITKNTQIAIIEMGANHPNEIKQLCEIADPNFGIITNIGKAHLEGFGSYQGVINTKNELYQHIITHHGKLFVNADNELLMQLSKNSNVVLYGKDDALFSTSRISSNNPFIELEVFENNSWQKIKSNLVGSYNFENIHAAICIGKYFNVRMHDISKAIENYHPTNNRSQIINTSRNTIIMDAYNANPSSMEAALINFSQNELPNKLAIIGDMRELGVDENLEHNNILDLIARLNFSEVILVGPVFSKLATSKHQCFDNSDNAASWLQNNPIKGKSILIKGSRGIQLEKLLPSL